MAITIKNIVELYDRDVFTTKGQYAGRVKDVEIDLSRGRIRALAVEVAKGSFLEAILGGKKTLIVPYSLISSIGDIVLIKYDFSELQKEQTAQETK
ncbi:MAG: PRC-barrel domain-containing protein [Candidatus Aenigmatarchaeota archaeon]|nr:PRC-barrel domain-containing protein [Candidatus Aenigmarchaeota archaeon]